MNYPSIAAQIVAAVGGRENLSHVMHCATCLRLTCLDESKINADAIADIEGVKGVFSAKGQFQIIFGSGTVNQVCDEVLKLTGNQPVVQPPKEAQGNVVNRFIKMLSDIFVPIIPAIVAGGLLMGINNIFTACNQEVWRQSLSGRGFRDDHGSSGSDERVQLWYRRGCSNVELIRTVHRSRRLSGNGAAGTGHVVFPGQTGNPAA